MRLEDHVVLAGWKLGRVAGRACLAGGLGAERPPVELAARTRGVGGVAAAAVRCDADHLHERVRGALFARRAAAREGPPLLGGGPDAMGLHAGVACGREGGCELGAATAGLERRGLGIPRGGSVRAAAAVGTAGGRAGAGRVADGAESRERARARSGRRLRGGSRPLSASREGGLVRSVGGRTPHVPSLDHGKLNRQVVHRRALGGPARGEAHRQGTLVPHPRDGVGSRRAGGALRDPERCQATPTSTSRKRAGAEPCETLMIWPGSPLPQSSSEIRRHSPGEQTASQPAQKRGVIPA